VWGKFLHFPPRLHFAPLNTFRRHPEQCSCPAYLAERGAPPGSGAVSPSTSHHGAGIRAVSLNSKLKVVEKRSIVR
jgi:hypothetical protein